MLYGTRVFLQATSPAELRIFIPLPEATERSEQAIEAALDEITVAFDRVGECVCALEAAEGSAHASLPISQSG
eukprot:3688135-Alexandrium_andersonii.AAC.1